MSVLGSATAVQDTSRPLSAVWTATPVGDAGPAPPTPSASDGGLPMRVPLRRAIAHTRVEVVFSAVQLAPAPAAANTSAVRTAALAEAVPASSWRIELTVTQP